MKNYLLFLVIALFFIGCTQKEIVVVQPEVVEKEKVVEIIEEKPPVIRQEDIFTQSEEIFTQSENNIAIVFPSKIVGKYAAGAINSVVAQLLADDNEFDLEVVNIYDEDETRLLKTLDDLHSKGYKNIILMTTQNSLKSLENSTKIDDFKIYLPLINKKESNSFLPNVVYGGIDYEQQIVELNKLSNNKNSMISSESTLGYKLRDIVSKESSPILLDETIEANRTNYKSLVSKEILNDSTLYLNTSIIKTSILLSQLRVYEITPYIVLSTQLNYTPLIISLTQYLDRENFYIANSIEKVDSNIEEMASLLDADLVYNWVNYSTLIGANYLLSKAPFSLNPIVDNQVQYRTTIYKNGIFGFIKFTN